MAFAERSAAKARARVLGQLVGEERLQAAAGRLEPVEWDTKGGLRYQVRRGPCIAPGPCGESWSSLW